MEMKTDSFTKCYVAFLDLLGFSEYVNNLVKEKDNGFFVLKTLFSELKELSEQVIKKDSIYPRQISEQVKYHIMSDSIVLLIPTNMHYSLEYLVDFCNEIFSFMLIRYGIFTRGAVLSGLIYMNDTIVFGKALVDAAMLEKNIAIYPRIILPIDVIDEYIKYMGLTIEDFQSSPFAKRIVKRMSLYETSPLEYFFYVMHKLSINDSGYSDAEFCLLKIYNILNDKKKMFLKPNHNNAKPNVAIKIFYFINYYNVLVDKYKLPNEIKEVDLSMEISVLLANIQMLCKEHNISIDKMLKECELSKSVIDNMKREKPSMPSVDKICEIAKYFNVSTDFLLGITNNRPFISVGDISGNQNSLIGNNNSDISIGATTISSQETALLEYFRKLDEKKKAKVLLYADELAEEK